MTDKDLIDHEWSCILRAYGIEFTTTAYKYFTFEDMLFRCYKDPEWLLLQSKFIARIDEIKALIQKYKTSNKKGREQIKKRINGINNHYILIAPEAKQTNPFQSKMKSTSMPRSINNKISS